MWRRRLACELKRRDACVAGLVLKVASAVPTLPPSVEAVEVGAGEVGLAGG